ncbi:MAG: insulinase family protein [Bacteroidales bacterium]|jgi:zinc protease|nr:insulinase family protein [Bacteroidales bacterium]MDD3811266.1 pitrilysin family protein [Bacteroidales bacterium]
MRKVVFLLVTSLFLLAGCQQKSELEIPYEKYSLDNGLDVILHQDHSDPIVALAILYHVGSNREDEGRTGFAHLFEHIMFQRSENIPEDQFFKIIQDAGGTLNGGTGNDATTYYEVVPKNAMEKILWMESDRMGFLTNTITEKTFQIQQNVVQNEKRQSVDNAPYGHVSEVVAKNLYPEGHPYSWTVIGEMEDLFNATLDDVKAFHARFYVPNNATLVLSGDFELEDAKQLIEKYFGEIPRGADMDDPKPWNIKLDETKKLYHEDNFARAPQLRMVWPTVEQFTNDAYALDYLGQLLSSGKKAPLYNVLVKEKKLTSSARAYNSSQEITGTFGLSVTANDGVSLKEVEEAVFEAFERFEKDGFTDQDLERLKAGMETGFYSGISSILGKSFQLAQYNEYAGSPDYYKQDIQRMKEVTKADILRVYEKYIKGKPYLATSFVPRGQADLVADGSINAGVVEEDIQTATQVEITDEGDDMDYPRTPSAFDRSVMPTDGPDPEITIPTIWTDQLANGMKIYGIEHTELPLVQFNITIKGGHLLEPMDKAGTASLMAQLMNEGTKNKTPQELEEAIELLGAGIRIGAGSTSVNISASCLTRNFEATLALLEEMLLEPRWDEEEFELAKIRTQNGLRRQKASPTSLASEQFQKLVYGEDHIFSVGSSGTEESVAGITIDDLKAFYEQNISPSVASFHIAGKIDKEQVVSALASINEKWSAREVSFPSYQMPPAPEKSQVWVLDVPGAKQSVIQIGCPGPLRTDPDYFAATVMNDKLGGSFNGWVNLVLREEKGYTYGARTSFSGNEVAGTFTASSQVRSSATLESVEIFRDLMAKYREGLSQEDIDFTRNSLLKSYARRYETLGALNGMLQEISTYNLPADFARTEQQIIRNMTVEQHKELAQKYIDPTRMYYVIAGDAATQADPLKSLGFGNPIIVK